jgi:hypothetical protein
LSEEIEVGGVETGVNVDALAGLASARPAIFDAGEPVAVEIDGTFGACALAQHLCVEDGYREEYDESEEQPPRGEGVAMEREPGGDQRCDDQQKADISEAAVHVFKVRDLHLASLLALFVLLGRGGA